jgi:hypothetical protein
MPDVRTLYLSALPIALLFGVVHLGLWLADHRRRPSLLWGLTNFFGATGAILLVARGAVPEWVTYGFSNTLIFGAALVFRAGLRLQAEQPVPALRYLAYTATFFVVFMSTQWGLGDLGLRVLVTSAALCLVNAGTAADLVLHRTANAPRVRQFLAVLCALHALFYLFRSACAVVLEPGSEFLNEGGLQSLTLALGTIKLVLWNIAALMLVPPRTAPPSAAA